MSKQTLRVIAFGAHPDDCEIFCGGLAAKLVSRGDAVKFVSLTNGNAGHHQDDREALKKRRLQETKNAANVLGIEYDVLDNNDGELTPSLDVRWEIIRQIRSWRAEVVLSHRPHDYHPDHRYTAMAVQDAAYMVMVPPICSETPPLTHNPSFFYFWDPFLKPYPFQPDVAVAVDEVMEAKWNMMHCHTSQFYEWLPYVDGCQEAVPDGEEERKKWMIAMWTPWLSDMTACCINQLENRYGGGRAIQLAETFEICEYGSRPTAEDIERIFPK
ncbi:MAG: PIG-L family deacetylase [Candidatus Omnitrophica bacterium]|nr:PIG-L family deacetylase [Candidatus Omnitrophota bacterium]